jgi:hypothetical protein
MWMWDLKSLLLVLCLGMLSRMKGTGIMSISREVIGRGSLFRMDSLRYTARCKVTLLSEVVLIVCSLPS